MLKLEFRLLLSGFAFGSCETHWIDDVGCWAWGLDSGCQVFRV